MSNEEIKSRQIDKPESCLTKCKRNLENVKMLLRFLGVAMWD